MRTLMLARKTLQFVGYKFSKEKANLNTSLIFEEFCETALVQGSAIPVQLRHPRGEKIFPPSSEFKWVMHFTALLWFLGLKGHLRVIGLSSIILPALELA